MLKKYHCNTRWGLIVVWLLRTVRDALGHHRGRPFRRPSSGPAPASRRRWLHAGPAPCVILTGSLHRVSAGNRTVEEAMFRHSRPGRRKSITKPIRIGRSESDTDSHSTCANPAQYNKKPKTESSLPSWSAGDGNHEFSELADIGLTRMRN